MFLYEWDSRVYIAPQDLQSSITIETKPRVIAVSGMDVDSYGGYVYWSNGLYKSSCVLILYFSLSIQKLYLFTWFFSC